MSDPATPQSERWRAPLWFGRLSAAAWRAVIIVLAIALLVSGIAAVRPVVLPVFLGLLFACALRPVAGALRSRLAPRPGLAAGLAIVLLAIALGALILGVPEVAAIGLLTFFGAYIPFIGATMSGMLAVLLALADGGLSLGVWMLVAVVAVQVIEGNLLQPWVQGRAMRLHPLVVVPAARRDGGRRHRRVPGSAARRAGHRGGRRGRLGAPS